MHKFKDGNIVSLKLDNFQTFRSQSFRFGPCLNLIAAPNGTGKSSIANAIALLFGGNAKTIGKTKEIGEYIRFGNEQASIEAEMCIEGKIMLFKRCITIGWNNASGKIDNTSVLNRNSGKLNREPTKSQYFIDNNLVTSLEYMRFLKKHRIATDNLSVFLPQEKVGAFCNMGPKELMDELLRNSEISLEKYYELQNEYREIENACETKFSTKRLMEGNLRKMGDALEEFEKARELEKRKFFLECKQTYMRYDELCEEYRQTKNNRKTQEARVTEFQTQIDENECEKIRMLDNKIVRDYEALCGRLEDENRDIRGIIEELRQNTRSCEYLCVDRTSIERKEKEWAETNIMLRKQLESEKERMRQCELEIVAEIASGVRKIMKFYEKMADSMSEKGGLEWEVLSQKCRMAHELSMELSRFEEIDCTEMNSGDTDCHDGTSVVDDDSHDRNESNKIRSNTIKSDKIKSDKIKSNKINRSYCLDSDKIVDLKNKFESLLPSMNEYDAGVRETEDAIREIKTACLCLQREVDSLESEKLRHGEHKERRLFQLQNYHHDTFKAVCWLRKNTSVFREEVLEPAYLHIEIDEEFRREIENLLNFQSLSSFLVQNEEDFSKLSRILKDELKLWVNIAEVGPRDANKPSGSQCGQPVHGSIKKKYGISGMASEFIRGRSEYIDFINRYSHLDHIPISKTDVRENELFHEWPALKRMVANNVYIEIRRSRYDKSWVMNRSLLRELNLFCVPKIDIAGVEQRLAQAKARREEHCRAMEKLLSKKVEHGKKTEDFRKEFSFVSVKKCLYLYMETRKQIAHKEETLRQQDLKEEKLRQAEKERQNNEQYDMLMNRLDVLLNPKNLPVMDVEAAEELVGQITNYENNIAFARHAMEAHEQAIEECNSRLEGLKQEIKMLKAAIRSSCDSEYLANDSYLESKDGPPQCVTQRLNANNDFSQTVDPLSLLKSKLSELPDSVNEILNEISFIDGKLAVMQNRGGIKTEYEKKEKALSLLSQSIAQLDAQKHALHLSLEAEKKVVTSLLEDLISPISATFSKFFARFGYRGELQWKLEDGNWILLILVSFRDNELLARLCAERQSGGEKSLATVLFLLALQQSTTVGFRLVDEINQGMDSTNERIVFELLSEMSLEKQFFIITPKLVDKLLFSKNTRAIILYGANGMTKALEKYTNALTT